MKKTCQLNFKVTQETHDAVFALANLEDLTPSEFLNNIITERLNVELGRLSVLRRWESVQVNDGNYSNGKT